MERKLVKQGRNALTVTLPSNWLKKNNLKQSDTINIFEKESDLVISTNTSKKQMVCEIDITDYSRALSYHIITGKYIEGYDVFKIKHNNFELAKEIGEGFLGIIIEEISSSNLVLKNIIKVPEENFNEILKRSCQLMLNQGRMLKEQLEKKKEFSDLKVQERLLDLNLFYCLRYINKYEKIREPYKYFLLCVTLETVGDFISEISKAINADLSTPEDLENINLLIEILENYVLYLFQNNLIMLSEKLLSFKQRLVKKSYISGICNCINENLYNYLGYLISEVSKNNTKV